jgi:molecular chaperone DnaK (HSP70)
VEATTPDWQSVADVAATALESGEVFLATRWPEAVGTTAPLTWALPDRQVVTLSVTVRAVAAADPTAPQQVPGAFLQVDPRERATLIAVAQVASRQGVAPNLNRGARRFLLDPRVPGQAAPGPPSQPPASSAPPSPAPSGRSSSTPPAPAQVGAAGSVATAVGIDFGTSYTSISVAVGDRVHLIPDEEGRTMLPSIVSFPQKSPRLVGWPARERLVFDPTRTIASPKRLLGRSAKDPLLTAYLSNLTTRAAAGAGGNIVYHIDEKHVSVLEACAAVIGRAREIAQKRLGLPCTHAVLSMPVSFQDAQKKALKAAALSAGFETLHFVEEPLAAAMSYGFGQDRNEVVAVYDFGGGTLDFTVLDISRNNFRVLASGGDMWLGGDDFDMAIANWAADSFWQRTQTDLRKRAVEWQRLMLASEYAKRLLTDHPATQISVPEIVERPHRIDLTEYVDRARFEQLCRVYFERSLVVCRQTLDRAGLEPPHVTQVVISGGISRVPFIQQGLSDFFEREVTPIVNPEAAICLGAGLMAARLVQHRVVGVAM